MAAEIDHHKQQIRESVREQRSRLTPDHLAQSRDALTTQLAALVQAREATLVSCYLPVQHEPDTRGFITWSRENGIELLFPSARADGLLDWIEPTWDGNIEGRFGIQEPLGTFVSPLAVSDVDLMLIPACAVDEAGVRLGWGRGYFDKSLGSMDDPPPVFAVVYDNEVVTQLPSELHDIPVTGVVTPERIRYLDIVS